MLTLLLADDSVMTQRLMALTFADEPLRLVTVADGQQAIDTMAATRPDIVLASTALPGTNGYELSQHMLGVEALKDVPVLLLSGAFESVDGVQLKGSGARGVIEKPLEPIAVINRVRELLGLKEARPAPPTGRLVTSATTTADKKAPLAAAPSRPAPEAPASAWDEPHEESGVAFDAKLRDDAAPGPSRGDYRDTLDTAFDSLDRHLAGLHQETPAAPRNPSPPLGQAAGATDPRSPGRRPAEISEGGTPPQVFEVDSEWFAADNKELDRATHHDILADAHEAMPPRAAAPGDAVFEVDAEWFAQDEKVRQSRLAQQRELAAEMGIHDIELPPAEPVPMTPAPAAGLDFDFGLDDRVIAPATPGPDSTVAATVAGDSPMETAPLEAPVPEALSVPRYQEPLHPESSAPAPALPVPQNQLAPLAPFDTGHTGIAQGRSSSMADDFATLLALETGDGPPAAPVAATMTPVAAPTGPAEITDAVIDQVAQRVADRLSSGAFGADLREAMTAVVRETVRSVVSETSERLVREEIARIKARVDRDTP